MKLKITTMLGDFTAEMSYIPSPDDTILNRMALAIDGYYSDKKLEVAKVHPNYSKDMIELRAQELVDEAELEHVIYESTAIANGAGQRISLSLKEKKITFSNW